MSRSGKTNRSATMVDLGEGSSDGSIVELCEQAANCVRLVVDLGECALSAWPQDGPADLHRALTAIELLLDRLTHALRQIGRIVVAQADAGLIAMDVGTPNVEEVGRAAAETRRLLSYEASPALDIAACAIDGARALIAHASLRPASCA